MGLRLRSRSICCRLLALVLPTMFITGPGFAKPRTHDGFQLRLAAGVGALHMERSVDATSSGTTVSGDSSLGNFGESFEASFGATPASGLVLGGGLYVINAVRPTLDRDVGTDVELVRDLTFVHVGAYIGFYPTPERGLHLGGSIGPSGAVGEAPGTSSFTERVGGIGPGLTAHAGYDFWIANEWSLGPELRVVAAAVRGTDEHPNVTTEERSCVYGASLSLTVAYH